MKQAAERGARPHHGRIHSQLDRHRNLRFYRGGSNLLMNTHARSYNRVSTITNQRPESIAYPEERLVLHASLAVGWEQANWVDDYRGKLKALNRAAQYTSRDKTKWLTIVADWNLQPAQ
jgi:hypothetical protein